MENHENRNNTQKIGFMHKVLKKNNCSQIYEQYRKQSSLLILYTCVFNECKFKCLNT